MESTATLLAAPGRVPDLQCLKAHQSAIGTPHSVSPRNRQPDQCIETVAFGLHSDPAEAIYSKATHVYNKMTISASARAVHASAGR